MKYLRLICLSSILTACASDPPPPAQGGEQFVSHDDQNRDVSENDTDQPSTYREDVNASASDTDSQRRENTSADSNRSDDSNRVALITTASASASSAMPPPTAVPVRADADNTRVNERDRSGETLTPTDQGGSEADRKMTQLVRQAVVKDDSLSFTAKNVKIITQNGKITLRGPVNTSAERTTIESAARKVAGSYQVDNLLEVKQ